jgi:hypothetical protein
MASCKALTDVSMCGHIAELTEIAIIFYYKIRI